MIIKSDDNVHLEKAYDLKQPEDLFIVMEDGRCVFISIISDTSGWCTCEQDYDGPLDFHIEQTWDKDINGDPHGYFVIEGCTGAYFKGDGWMTDDDADFYPGATRQATQSEIEAYA